MCLRNPVFPGSVKKIRVVKEYKYGIAHLQYFAKVDSDLCLQLQSHIDYCESKT